MKLAITGISGSGKDYLVDILVNDYSFTRVSFSDQLKKLAVKIYPWMEKDYRPFEKEQPLDIVLSSGEHITKTPRKIWLHLNLLRDIEDGLFIRMLEEEISTIEGNIVISDIRTENEWNWVNANGYRTIYIDPLKKIYTPKTFDDFSISLKNKTNYVFENDFSGHKRFKKFVENEIEK